MNFEIQPNSPIGKIRERITPETKEGVRSHFERSEGLHRKMKEKGMEKVHLAYALLNSELNFDHDFIQGYLSGDTDYFSEISEDNHNLKNIEQLIEKFNLEEDGNKMFPINTHNKN